MRKFFQGTAKHATYHLFHTAINGRSRRRVITKFADKLGLVYFGSLDQRSDECKIVRGFTVSSSHQDVDYAVGSVDDFDTAVVNRNDALWQTDGSVAIYNWLIVAINLHTQQDIPHFLVSARNHDLKSYKSFFEIFHTMREINLGTFEDYGQDFTNRFSIFAQPSESIEVERLLPANAARVLGAHLWPLSIELHEGVLYVYSDDKKITPHLIDTMLEVGLWLANHLDTQAELV